eukprot:scaffold301_cov243-Pinguiococcus_pyrenoidosus.AAC.173
MKAIFGRPDAHLMHRSCNPSHLSRLRATCGPVDSVASELTTPGRLRAVCHLHCRHLIRSTSRNYNTMLVFFELLDLSGRLSCKTKN